MTPSQSIAQIVIALPPRPTDGDLLLALITAEQAGYERGLQAEESPDGMVEIRAHLSVTGAPVTYTVNWRES